MLEQATFIRSLARPAVDSILRTSMLAIAKSIIDSLRRHLQLLSSNFLMMYAFGVCAVGGPGGSLRRSLLLDR